MEPLHMMHLKLSEIQGERQPGLQDKMPELAVECTFLPGLVARPRPALSTAMAATSCLRRGRPEVVREPPACPGKSSYAATFSLEPRVLPRQRVRPRFAAQLTMSALPLAFSTN